MSSADLPFGDFQRELRRLRAALALGDGFQLFVFASGFASTRKALVERLSAEPGWEPVVVNEEHLRKQTLARAIVDAHEGVVAKGVKPLVIVTGLVDDPEVANRFALLNQARNEVIARTRGPVVFVLGGKAQVEELVRGAPDTWSVRTQVAVLGKVGE